MLSRSVVSNSLWPHARRPPGSCIQLFATPGTVAHQTPLSMGFHRQEYWGVVPFSPPGDLLDPGMEPMSPALAGEFFTTGATCETPCEEYFLAKKLS